MKTKYERSIFEKIPDMLDKLCYYREILGHSNLVQKMENALIKMLPQDWHLSWELNTNTYSIVDQHGEIGRAHV